MGAMTRCGAGLLAACGILLGAAGVAGAWEPGGKELDAAVSAGDFGGYFSNVTAWVDQKVPEAAADVTAEKLQQLLRDGAFAVALDQRQFIARFGVQALDAFAKADAGNVKFLDWALKDAGVLEAFLQAAGPTAISARDDNSFTIPAGALDIWRKIWSSDPESRQGIYLRLAMATAIAPPGSRSYGAGGSKEAPAEPVGRYNLYKQAHKNGELFPSFDNLTVWDYTKVVSCHGSDRDITWARQMINTWRPDLRINEQVVNSTSEVWRRNSPHGYTNGMPSVLDGGGKCGPRSSWAVFICQAFGIPAIGVGQPAHACAAAKSAYPELQPQPGSAWKVHQGQGWNVSRLDGTSGPLFLEAVRERAMVPEFARIEHLRWLASALGAKEPAAAVMAAAKAIRESAQEPKPAPAPAARPPAPAEEPFKPAPGTIHIEAEAFAGSFAEPAYPGEQKGCVQVHDCYTGGKQLYFQRNMKTAWVEYPVDVPAPGTYAVVMRLAAVNFDQVLDVGVGTNVLATVRIPNTLGLWTTTEPVRVKLEKGAQALRLTVPMQRGVAIRWLELRRQD